MIKFSQCPYCLPIDSRINNCDKYNLVFHRPLFNQLTINNPQIFMYCQISNSNSCTARYAPVLDQDKDSFNELTRDSNEKPLGSNFLMCTCNEFINHTLQNRVVPVAPIVREERRESVISEEQSSILEDIKENSIYSNISVMSDPMCRFCHLSMSTSQDMLISPCLCSGTLKLVHQSCLKTWLEVSKKQRENNPDKVPHCELCNFKYVRKRKFQFGNLRYPKLSQNDCALHLIFLCSLLVMLTSASVTILCFAMEKSGQSTVARSHIYDPESSSNGNPGNHALYPTDLLFRVHHSFNIKNRQQYSNFVNIPQPTPVPTTSSTTTATTTKTPMKISQDIQQKLELCKYFDNHMPSKFNIHLPSRDKLKLYRQHCAAYLKSLSKQQNQKSKNNNVNSNNDDNSNNIEASVINRRVVQPRVWILSPEEAVTLASGVIFFIAFFIAMVVQVKSSYTCYQLVMQWIRLNYIYEVQPLVPLKHSTKPPSSRTWYRSCMTGSIRCNNTSNNNTTSTTNQIRLFGCGQPLRRNKHTQQQHTNTTNNIIIQTSHSNTTTIQTNMNSSIAIANHNTPREYIERCITEI